MTLSKHLKERASQEKKVHVSFAHIDMCDGDIVAAILLSQIVYWFTPNKEGAHKITIRRASGLWLAKKDSDWKNEIRLTVDQARRARSVLVRKGYIKCETHKFKGIPQVHIAIIEDAYMEAWNSAVDSVSEPIELVPEPESNSGLNPSQVGLEPESLYSEITAENTTKHTSKPRDSEITELVNEWNDGYFNLTGKSRGASTQDAVYLQTMMREYGLGAADVRHYIQRLFTEWKSASRDNKRFWPLRITALDGKMLSRLDTEIAADEEETAELMRLGGYEYTPAHLRKQA